jgi:3-phosphoshikimate 1-carboxyvinyltransferase
MTVPGDISSAAFWIVAASVVPGSEVRLNGTGLNPSRTGILDVMSEVGVTVETDSPREEMGEPVGNLIVRSPKHLSPFTIAGDLVPRLIDEIPVLAVLATQCEGVSEIRDAKELRVKESDRIALVAEGLNAMGARVTALEDGLRIEGPTPLTGSTIHAHGDHRIAMAFAIAGLIAEGTTTLENTDSIQTSYPEFWDHLATLTRA